MVDGPVTFGQNVTADLNATFGSGVSIGAYLGISTYAGDINFFHTFELIGIQAFDSAGHPVAATFTGEDGLDYGTLAAANAAALGGGASERPQAFDLSADGRRFRRPRTGRRATAKSPRPNAARAPRRVRRSRAMRRGVFAGSSPGRSRLRWRRRSSASARAAFTAVYSQTRRCRRARARDHRSRRAHLRRDEQRLCDRAGRPLKSASRTRGSRPCA